jgi:hypothetical protein
MPRSVTWPPERLGASVASAAGVTWHKMEIFEQRTGHAEPVRRLTHQINAPDDATAKVEAQLIFDALAATIPLANFALWDDGGRLVCEMPRGPAPG